MSISNFGNATAEAVGSADNVQLRRQRPAPEPCDVGGDDSLRVGRAECAAYTYNAANELTQIQPPSGASTAISYDANGNQAIENTAGALTTYTWDGENRLVEVASAAGVETQAYDANGLRQSLATSEGVTRFAWDGQNVLLDEDDLGILEARYTDFPGYWGGLSSRGAYPADSVWVEDALPPGAVGQADGGDAWTWVSSNPTPFSGALASQSNIASGEHQHYFMGASATLSVDAGDVMVGYVYLDPANPPTEVMLQWHDGGSWEHRAYWGANSIPFGTDGTESRRYMGPLPAAGQWVRLEAPASAVGLEGLALDGMAFTLYGGRATWDHGGKRAAAASSFYGFDSQQNARVLTDSSGDVTDSYVYTAFGVEMD